MVAVYNAIGYEQKQIIISKKYVENCELDLKFESPDANSPANVGNSEDTRKMALCMYRMRISSTKDEATSLMEPAVYNYIGNC